MNIAICFFAAISGVKDEVSCWGDWLFSFAVVCSTNTAESNIISFMLEKDCTCQFAWFYKSTNGTLCLGGFDVLRFLMQHISTRECSTYLKVFSQAQVVDNAHFSLMRESSTLIFLCSKRMHFPLRNCMSMLQHQSALLFTSWIYASKCFASQTAL